MKVIIKTFDVGRGDCYFILFKNVDSVILYSIMVDGGDNITQCVQEFISDTLKNHINIVIVTHIDKDHIGGILTLVNSIGVESSRLKDLKIDNILYNCYQRDEASLTPGKQLSDLQRKIFQKLNKRLGSYVKDLDELSIGVEQSSSLAEAIISKKLNWERKEISTTSAPFSLEAEGILLGKLYFLSPTSEQLKFIYNEFRHWFCNKFFDRNPEEYEKVSSIYELMLNHSEFEADRKSEKKDRVVSLNGFNIDTIVFGSDNSPYNSSSIAFLLVTEDQEKKYCLFLGDSNPETVITSYNTLKKDLQIPKEINIVKLSHHGTSNNMNQGLINVIDPTHICVTGYTAQSRYNCDPAVSLLKKETQEKRYIHFSHKTEFSEALEKATDIQVTYNFEIDNDAPNTIEI